MKQLAWALYIFAIAIIGTLACTDPTTLGADLLEGDEAEVGFTDTLSVKATTVLNDSVLVYTYASSILPLTGYLIGDMIDPIFGKSKSQIYTQMARAFAIPDRSNTKLDSIVLVLPYNKAGNYGDLTQNYGISVHRITEYIKEQQNFYSNASFSSSMASLGAANFVPNLDSVTIFDYTRSKQDTFKLGAQLRIPLDRALGEELLKLDSATLARDTTFYGYFNGLHLKPTTTNQGILSFNLTDGVAGVFVYYTKNDTIKTQLKFNFRPSISAAARVVKFEQDRKNTVVERYAKNPNLGDSLLFVQGMAGVTTQLEIPYLENLQGAVINKAELEVRIATLPGDDLSIFKPAPQLFLYTKDDNGNVVAIDDVLIFQAIDDRNRDNGKTLNAFYGGIPIDGNPGEPQLYRMNISTHFQNIISKKRNNILYLNIPSRQQQPQRVVLYGAKHPLYSIKLKVAYTKL